jgi:L-aminopeptidase/D-esterase-like protein
VGHVTDLQSLTGCTVILPDRPAVGALEIPGWAAGVYGIEFLDPRHVAPTVDGIMLAGGSAFGLEAVWGALAYLEEHGRGYPVGRTVVPHVAGAIVFDLNVGDHRVRPDRAMGYAACVAAHPGKVEEGSVGAGTGATVGKLYGITRAMRGGLGCARVDVDGVAVAALMVVNAVGDVRDPVTGRLLAGARDSAEGRELVDTAAALEAGAVLPHFRPVNTTIGVIDHRRPASRRQPASRTQPRGLRAPLSPPHLPTDGDALFCLSIGEERRAGSPRRGGRPGRGRGHRAGRPLRDAAPGLPARET